MDTPGWLVSGLPGERDPGIEVWLTLGKPRKWQGQQGEGDGCEPLMLLNWVRTFHVCVYHVIGIFYVRKIETCQCVGLFPAGVLSRLLEHGPSSPRLEPSLHLPLAEDRKSSGRQEPSPGHPHALGSLPLCLFPFLGCGGVTPHPGTRVHTPHTRPSLAPPEAMAHERQRGLFLWSRVCSWGPSRPVSLTLTLDLTIFSLIPSSSLRTFPAPSLSPYPLTDRLPLIEPGK